VPGMNKLLQRLPESSREEVRNQAIVLVQQLTANNEEMKKTVVFNEVSKMTFFTNIYTSSISIVKRIYIYASQIEILRLTAKADIYKFVLADM
jgi:hypothetical protein